MAAPRAATALSCAGLARHAATRPENLRSHPARAALLGAVERAPGISLAALRKRLGCSAGTIQHHVNLTQARRAALPLDVELRIEATPGDTEDGEARPPLARLAR